MSKLEIITNNHPRPVLRWNHLTEKERAEFDWLDTEDSQMESEFMRYKGAVYYLGDFMRVPDAPEFKPWNGYAPDSYFSGVLVRYDPDGETVTAGRYYS